MAPRKRSRSTSRRKKVTNKRSRSTSRKRVVRRKRSKSRSRKRSRSKSRSRKRSRSKSRSRKRKRSSSKGRKKLGRKMKKGEGYCVKCKTARDIKNPRVVTMKNGRKAMRGNCPVCGTGMFRIM